MYSNGALRCGVCASLAGVIDLVGMSTARLLLQSFGYYVLPWIYPSVVHDVCSGNAARQVQEDVCQSW